jgi:hypothetical protein
MLTFTDERVRWLGEILANMKMIKFYAYERLLQTIVHRLRREELQRLRWLLYIKEVRFCFELVLSVCVCVFVFAFAFMC